MFIRDFFRKLSITHKIILSIYIAVIFVTTLMGWYSYMMLEKNMIIKVSAANLGIAREISNNINFLQREVENVSIQVGLNNTVQDSLKNESGSLYIENSLSYIVGFIANKSYNNFTILYGLNDKFTPFISSNDGSSGVYPFSTFEKTHLYKKIYDLEGKPLWFVLEDEIDKIIQNNKHRKVAMARMVRDLVDYKNIGLLIISVNEEYIRKMYASNLKINSGSIIIIDKEGNVVSQDGVHSQLDETNNRQYIEDVTKKALGSEGAIIENISGENMLVAYSNNNFLGWKIYYTVPLVTLTQETAYIKTNTIIIVMVCLIALLPFMLLISSLLTAPIKRLLNSMERFQKGNFNESVEIKSSDEIGQLGRGYNKMVGSIKELIDEVYVLQVKERDAELTALQAQINPHFLYNTLDVIFWKAQLSGDKEIGEMIYSLSRFFRLSLNRGEGMTIVSREKELIEHYLLLLKIRFKQRLTYELHIDDDILSFMIPKLILQPFVENAVLHGLENKEGGVKIIVTGVRVQGEIRFTIEDDGIGMDEGTISRIFLSTTEVTSDKSVVKGGYSVKNVNERLKLIFNDKYSLKFSSELGKGTKVELYVPVCMAQ